MLLRRVLQEVEAAQGPISLAALSQKLDVEPSALEGMLAFWVRKGRLKENVPATDPCPEGDCTSVCVGIERCPLVQKVHRSFSLETRHEASRT